MFAQNERVLTVTEPQVWAMIGVFATAFFAVITVVSTLFIRVLRSELGGLRAEMNGRFERVEARLDHLDRDVNALVKHTFGFDRE